jgi:hypothetical protein
MKTVVDRDELRGNELWGSQAQGGVGYVFVDSSVRPELGVDLEVLVRVLGDEVAALALVGDECAVLDAPISLSCAVPVARGNVVSKERGREVSSAAAAGGSLALCPPNPQNSEQFRFVSRTCLLFDNTVARTSVP